MSWLWVRSPLAQREWLKGDPSLRVLLYGRLEYDKILWSHSVLGGRYKESESAKEDEGDDVGIDFRHRLSGLGLGLGFKRRSTE